MPEEQQDDLFEDQPTEKSGGEGDSKTFNEPAKDQPKTEEKPDDKDDAKQDEPKEDKAGEKEEPTEPPSEDQKDTTEGSKVEKMIPESRFKAALKDATDKLNAANTELSQLKAAPVPDKTSDPDGYDLHVRMESSKAAMRATHPDYQEVIEHYKEMADKTPSLNEAVAKDPIPAKFAYDLAKEDMRLQKLSAIEKSDEWKEFQEFKKNKGAKKEETNTDDKKDVGSQLSEGGKPKVPNLNRVTNVSKGNSRVEEDDELFAGAAF